MYRNRRVIRTIGKLPTERPEQPLLVEEPAVDLAVSAVGQIVVATRELVMFAAQPGDAVVYASASFSNQIGYEPSRLELLVDDIVVAAIDSRFQDELALTHRHALTPGRHTFAVRPIAGDQAVLNGQPNITAQLVYR